MTDGPADPAGADRAGGPALTDGGSKPAGRPNPVVVGYDGSEGSARAVLWAARYATAAAMPLVVVHCWVWPFFTHDLGPVSGVEDSGLRREAEKIAAEGHDLAVRAEPGLVCSTRLLVGFPAETLTRLSAQSSLIVTGTRGLGGFSGLLVGSVSLHLAAGSSCPLVVVREAGPAHDTILVAVDGSPESDRALVSAADLARTLHTSLHILHVSTYRRHTAEQMRPGVADPVVERARLLLHEATDVTVTEETAVAPSIPGLLVQRADHASCIVLGAKGSNTLGARLGSTVHAVLHHTRGNVVVVR
ncbi:universal stress protein [Arthrobacter agilis]|uniref:universal stress protein n=1 Tax=Arthrobacter agilis TaxID=37921 RepID=UPI002781B2DB|nr:universal stress protein [Arthrobacter agilis]MDQ0734872.1 nucleotide-binding universal stress UspA family protein [Arthrobacter agilis]